jgi:hypothetical protein
MFTRTIVQSARPWGATGDTTMSTPRESISAEVRSGQAASA